MARWFEEWRAKLWPRIPRTQPEPRTTTQPEAKENGFAWDAEKHEFQLRDSERYEARKQAEVQAAVTEAQDAEKAREKEWNELADALYPEDWAKAGLRFALAVAIWGGISSAAKEYLHINTLEFFTVCGLALLWCIHRSLRLLTVIMVAWRRGR
jgi:hypothetical protein